MEFICIFIIIWSFIKTFSYATYEIQQAQNKKAGIIIIVLDFLSAIFTTMIIFSRFAF